MSWLAAAVTIVLLADSRVAVYEQDDVTIEVTISSQVFSYVVTNTGTKPLTRFEIDLYETYNAGLPQDWLLDKASFATGHLETWTDDPSRAIMPNRPPLTFSTRVTSVGAGLGLAAATLTAADGTTVEFPGIWAPVPPRRGLLFLVAGTVIAVALLCTALAVRREKRAAN